MDGGVRQGESGTGRRAAAVTLPGVLGKLVAPVPLFALQPLLARIVREVAVRRPELFERLGRHIHSLYVIDVAELPFVLALRPDPGKPELRAHRRHEALRATSTISGPFLGLLRIVDGRGDSDALFFSRDIRITGDTEAAVCLRQALDDMDGSIVEDLLRTGGLPLAPLRLVLGHMRYLEERR